MEKWGETVEIWWKMRENGGRMRGNGGKWGNNGGRTRKNVVQQEKKKERCTNFSNWYCFYRSHFPHFSGGSDGKLAVAAVALLKMWYPHIRSEKMGGKAKYL